MRARLSKWRLVTSRLLIGTPIVVAGLIVCGCQGPACAVPTDACDEVTVGGHGTEGAELSGRLVQSGWLALPKETRMRIRDVLRDFPLAVYSVEEKGAMRSHLRLPPEIKVSFEAAPKATIEQLLAAAHYGDPIQAVKAVSWAMGLLTGTETAAHVAEYGRPSRTSEFVSSGTSGVSPRDDYIASLEQQLQELR